MPAVQHSSEVACVGDLMLELFVTVRSPSKTRISLLDYPQGELGGSARNVGHYLRGLGRAADVVSVVPPSYEAWCRGELAASGLTTDHLQYFGRFLDYLIVCANADPFLGLYFREELPAAECRRLLRGNRRLAGRVLALVGSRRHGVRVLSSILARAGRFDVVVFSPSYPLFDYTPEDLVATLRASDVVIVNEREAQHLAARFPDLDALVGSGRANGTRAPVVVVTAAASGATLRMAGQSWHVPSFSSSREDVIGAGDAFTAGFIDAVLDGRSPMEAAVRGACVAAAMVDVGRIRTNLSRAEIDSDRFSGARLPLTPST